MLERLKKLQSGKGRFGNPAELSRAIDTDTSFRKEIEILSKSFLNRPVSGCKNCYADAYMELINLSITKAMEQNKCQFELKRGKLLYDIKGDASKLLSQANITGTLALYHLKTNPSCEKYFSQLPENWREMVQIPNPVNTNPDLQKSKRGHKKRK